MSYLCSLWMDLAVNMHPLFPLDCMNMHTQSIFEPDDDDLEEANVKQ